MSAVDALWAPLVEHGSQWCAPNVHAAAQWLVVDGTPWRAALTLPGPRNSYVVSPAGQYLDYAMEETRRLGPAQRLFSRTTLHAIAPVLRRLDPVLCLDALPVSTVLRPSRTRASWATLTEAARVAHPATPRVVRAIDSVTGADTLAHLTSLGYELIPSRLVFHQDPARVAFWSHRNLRHDRALAARAPLEVRTLHSPDAPRIADLYWMLYGDRHSTLNPRFSPEWLAHGMAAGVLRGEGIMHHGQLAAAYLSYSIDHVMTNPVFGYDTTLPQAIGLYRRLSLLALESAHQTGHLLHASSGAPAFKATRGGLPAIEYHAVDLHGVSGHQRLAWDITLRIARRIGPAMLRAAH